MKKFLATVLLFFLLLPALIFAAENTSLKGLTEKAGTSAGYDVQGGDTQLAKVVGSIVRVFLSIIGIIFVCYIIYGGYTWMMAAGNDDSVKKAKDIIRNGIIGLIVTLSALSIYILINQFLIGSQTGAA